MKISTENSDRILRWGAKVQQLLHDHDLMQWLGEGDQRFPWPCDEEGTVEGAFLPLGEPATCALVVALLREYMERAAKNAEEAASRRPIN